MQIIYNQTENYLNLNKQEGKSSFFINIDKNNFCLYQKEYKKMFSFNIPLFHKITSINAPIFDTKESFFLVIEKLKQIVNNPFCIRAQIESNPTKKDLIPKNDFFNSTKFTYLLDLKNIKTIEDYLKSIKSKVRNNINRANRQNLRIVKLNSIEELDTYINLRNENRNSNGLPEIDKRHFIESFKILGIKDIMRYYIVYQEDVPLVGQVVLCSDNTYNLAGVAVSPKVYQLKLNANDFMQFNIIQMAIKENIRYIDWGGAQPNSSDNKMKSIDRFKAKWGGELVEYPVYLKGYK